MAIWITETQPQANMNVGKIEVFSTTHYPTPLHCALPLTFTTTPTQYFVINS